MSPSRSNYQPCVIIERIKIMSKTPNFLTLTTTDSGRGRVATPKSWAKIKAPRVGRTGAVSVVHTGAGVLPPGAPPPAPGPHPRGVITPTFSEHKNIARYKMRSDGGFFQSDTGEEVKMIKFLWDLFYWGRFCWEFSRFLP